MKKRLADVDRLLRGEHTRPDDAYVEVFRTLLGAFTGK